MRERSAKWFSLSLGERAGVRAEFLFCSALRPLLCVLYLLLCVLCPLPARAQQTLGPINWSSRSPVCFSGAGVTNGVSPAVNFASNVAWFCTSAKGLGAPRVTYLNFSSDLVSAAGGNLQAYACTNSTFITNNCISGTNQLCTFDNSLLASNDVIVLQDAQNDKYQRCIITNIGNGFIGIWPSTGMALTNGDQIYKMQPMFTLASVIGTTNYNAYGSIAGREGFPLLLDIQFSNTAAIKACVGDFIHRN